MRTFEQCIVILIVFLFSHYLFADIQNNLGILESIYCSFWMHGLPLSSSSTRGELNTKKEKRDIVLNIIVM